MKKEQAMAEYLTRINEKLLRVSKDIKELSAEIEGMAQMLRKPEEDIPRSEGVPEQYIKIVQALKAVDIGTINDPKKRRLLTRKPEFFFDPTEDGVLYVEFAEAPFPVGEYTEYTIKAMIRELAGADVYVRSRKTHPKPERLRRVEV